MNIAYACFAGLEVTTYESFSLFGLLLLFTPILLIGLIGYSFYFSIKLKSIHALLLSLPFHLFTLITPIVVLMILPAVRANGPCDIANFVGPLGNAIETAVTTTGYLYVSLLGYLPLLALIITLWRIIRLSIKNRRRA
jgi:hypothetical protein